MHGGTAQAGHYEVRTETRLGVQVAADRPGQRRRPCHMPDHMAPERVPPLAEALNAHLASDPADAG